MGARHPAVGIRTLGIATYHADPCPEPSLSASIAKILCTSSPAHARVAHPRLNPDFQQTDDSKYDLGTVAHALLLQGEDVAVQIDAPDWRTNAAKEQRDAARAAGQVPLLTKDWDRARRMVEAVRGQLHSFDATPGLLADGKPEQTLIWQEGDIWCRALVDWLHDDYTAVDDLKTTSRSANPETWTRTLFGIGADVQTAFYLRGMKAITGEEPDFRFLVVETAPPYALSVVSLGPDCLALAEAKVEFAIKKWGECLASGSWPGYPTRVCHAEMPAYEETRWMEHEEIAA